MASAVDAVQILQTRSGPRRQQQALCAQQIAPQAGILLAVH